MALRTNPLYPKPPVITSDPLPPTTTPPDTTATPQTRTGLPPGGIINRGNRQARMQAMGLTPADRNDPAAIAAASAAAGRPPGSGQAHDPNSIYSSDYYGGGLAGKQQAIQARAGGGSVKAQGRIVASDPKMVQQAWDAYRALGDPSSQDPQVVMARAGFLNANPEITNAFANAGLMTPVEYNALFHRGPDAMTGDPNVDVFSAAGQQWLPEGGWQTAVPHGQTQTHQGLGSGGIVNAADQGPAGQNQQPTPGGANGLGGNNFQPATTPAGTTPTDTTNSGTQTGNAGTVSGAGGQQAGAQTATANPQLAGGQTATGGQLPAAGAPPPAPEAANILPEKDQVTADQTVQGQLSALLKTGNPLLDAARARAMQAANARGLQNSSMAAQAGEEAVLSQALPIASEDAAAYRQQALTNQTAANQFLLSKLTTQEDLNKAYQSFLQNNYINDKDNALKKYISDASLSVQQKIAAMQDATARASLDERLQEAGLNISANSAAAAIQWTHQTATNLLNLQTDNFNRYTQALNIITTSSMEPNDKTTAINNLNQEYSGAAFPDGFDRSILALLPTG